MGKPVPRARLVVDAMPRPGEACRLDGEEAAHARARRVAAGDIVVLLDGRGREALGRVRRVGRGAVEIDVETVRPGPDDSHGSIHLLVAAVRSERLAWIAEKATELGAARLTLLTTDRTQRFRATEGLVHRLERVVREAAKQSERASWPKIDGPLVFAEALAAAPGGVRLILDSSGEPFPTSLAAGSTALLVGPEGGWTEGELEAAISSGWIAASLAAGKLRAETAAVAALTLARTALARAARP
jgi:16S rRNA (uracil1498-N3)-methyltransferase